MLEDDSVNEPPKPKISWRWFFGSIVIFDFVLALSFDNSSMVDIDILFEELFLEVTNILSLLLLIRVCSFL